MGIFDSVSFTCPTCAVAIEVQSKAGPDPYLHWFTPDATPLYIALDIAGETVRCECGAVWRVVAEPPFPTAVRLRLVSEEEPT